MMLRLRLRLQTRVGRDADATGFGRRRAETIAKQSENAYGLMQHEMQRRMRVDEATEVMQDENRCE